MKIELVPRRHRHPALASPWNKLKDEGACKPTASTKESSPVTASRSASATWVSVMSERTATPCSRSHSTVAFPVSRIASSRGYLEAVEDCVNNRVWGLRFIFTVHFCETENFGGLLLFFLVVKPLLEAETELMQPCYE